jgi:hemerythrin-like domain-containing protein
MTILLADLLDDLHEDHRNMAIVLGLLERQVEHIREGAMPDYELICEIMRYMTVYSDAVHHPKEDLLYAGMRAEEPGLADGLERVEPEHKDIAALGEKLRNDVEAVASGNAVTRERVIRDTEAYVTTLRKHMVWEEEDLFRRARQLVQNEQDMFVDIAHLDTLDPVFGPEREHSFANLLQNIKDLAG